MKNIIISIVALLTLMSSNANAVAAKECPIGKAETLVCSAIMCSVGILIAESRPKCIQVNRKFAIYLATLGFWSKPPSCKSRDENCNVTGKATAKVDPKSCEALGSPADIIKCKAAGGIGVPVDDCSVFEGKEKTQCEGGREMESPTIP